MLMAWDLTENLKKLRTEFNLLGPNRDKTSDGTIGDQAHASGVSGHNPDRTGNAEHKDGDSQDEVRGLDVDASGPWRDGQSMEKCVQHLVARGRTGNLESVIRYIIFDRRIWSASTGWAQREYTGSNPHDKHAHFSGAWTQSADENGTYDYGIANLGGDMPLDTADKTWLTDNLGPAKVWAHPLPDPNADDTPRQAGSYQRYNDQLHIVTRNTITAAVGTSAAADAARDAAAAARDAGMLAILQTLAASTGVLTADQLAVLTDQVEQAATAAGVQATAALEAKVDSLRSHLGDDD